MTTAPWLKVSLLLLSSSWLSFLLAAWYLDYTQFPSSSNWPVVLMSGILLGCLILVWLAATILCNYFFFGMARIRLLLLRALFWLLLVPVWVFLVKAWLYLW